MRIGTLSSNLVGPDGERREKGRAEAIADGDVRCVAAARHQHASAARYVVSRIEGVPLTADIGFEPGSEIGNAVRRRGTDVAEITSAIARGNVHAATEGDRQV